MDKLTEKYLFEILKVYDEAKPSYVKQVDVFKKLDINPDRNPFAKNAMQIYIDNYAESTDKSFGTTTNESGTEMYKLLKKEKSIKNRTSLRVAFLCVLAIITVVIAFSNMYMSCTKTHTQSQGQLKQ